MLSLIGDILNWLAAGVMFPLMLLPLSVLIFSGKQHSTLGWLILTVLSAGAGVVFSLLAPRLSAGVSSSLLMMFGAVLSLTALSVFIAGGAERAIRRLSPIFDFVTRYAGRAVMWLLLVMALVQFGVVFLRYVFGVNFIYMQESITYMHGAVFLAAAGYALLTDDHVRVDIFYSQASPRRKALIDFLGTYLFLFPVCLVLLWTASLYVGNSWAVQEGSTEASGIQGVFLIKTLIPVFAVLLAMAGFCIAARASDELRGRD